MPELVRQRHQRHRAQARLDVLFRRIGLQVRELLGQHLVQRVHAGADIDRVIAGAQRLGAQLRVFQTVRGRIFRRQHHAPHALRPQRVHRNRRRQRRVDAARHAQHDAGEAVLVDIVAERHHRRAVFGFPAAGELSLRLARKLVRLTIEGDQRRAGDEIAEQLVLRPVEIDGIARPVEDQFVLPAHLVHEQVRHARFRPGGEAGVPLHLHGAAPGAAIRHDQHLRARLGQRRGHARIPDVLTDRDAARDAVQLEHGQGASAGIEDALLVEHAIVRQLALVIAPGHRAIFQQHGGIVPLVHVHPRAADDHGWAVGRLRGEGLNRLHGVFHGGGFQHQVLGRIAEDEQFGEDKQVSALVLRLGIRPARQLKVSLDVPHHGIELRDQDFQIFAHEEHLGGNGGDVISFADLPRCSMEE